MEKSCLAPPSCAAGRLGRQQRRAGLATNSECCFTLRRSTDSEEHLRHRAVSISVAGCEPSGAEGTQDPRIRTSALRRASRQGGSTWNAALPFQGPGALASPGSQLRSCSARASRCCRQTQISEQQDPPTQTSAAQCTRPRGRAGREDSESLEPVTGRAAGPRVRKWNRCLWSKTTVNMYNWFTPGDQSSLAGGN
jgi:hypothetical protein